MGIVVAGEPASSLSYIHDLRDEQTRGHNVHAVFGALANHGTIFRPSEPCDWRPIFLAEVGLRDPGELSVFTGRRSTRHIVASRD